MMNMGTFTATNIPQNDGYVQLKEIEIAFMARIPLSSVALRLQVDDESHDFKPEVRARSVKWNCGIYVSHHSQITLSVYRAKGGIHNLNPFADPIIGNVVFKAGDPAVQENSVHTCTLTGSSVRANITFAETIDRNTFIDLMGRDVRSALASKVVLLDRMKNVTTFLKVVFNVGKEVSELNDIAKVVFGLANRLFKVLQEQQEFHHMAVDLAELLNVKLHLSDIIPERLRQGSVQKSLKDMLDVIEETLKFIKAHIGIHSLNGLVGRRKELTDLKAKLFAASEDLSLCLTANVFVMVSDVHQNVYDSLLKEKLRPVLPARFSIDHYFLDGTREAPLEDIMKWARTVDSSSRLYHVHGVAGSGKSSITSAVCQKLEETSLLAGAFFCKRDLPEQRDPSRILPSLSYTLALSNEAYRGCVMRSLKDEVDITSRPIEQQLKVLFGKPLSELPRNGSESRPSIFIVDALDECGDDVSRLKIANSLCQIAALADWLKIFVTSRPTNELMRKFQCNNTLILSVNLNEIDAENDIKLYTRDSLEKLVADYGLSISWLTEETVQKLSTLASGLFIWTSTMIRYVRHQLDMDNAMQIILSGNAVAAETTLDDLYIKVIESCGFGDENLILIKSVLGIVSITARNMPLSIDGLHDFLQGSGKKVSKGTLVAVINRLRSVLYEDVSKGNAIRVCHPSFLDFLEHPERSGVYWTNIDELHASMVETSLNVMKTKLKFNICDLESSYVANKDIGDLTQRIKKNIPELLIYSCLYWTGHLAEANRKAVDVLVVEFFLSLEAIYWIEVLSLVDEVKRGLDAIQTVITFFKDNNTLCSLATDLYRLVSLSFDAISHSTPHLYISALAWLPESSPLRPMLSYVKSDALISSGRNKEWSSMLWMTTLGERIQQVVFSPDDKTVAACCEDGNISIFDAKTGVLEMKLQGHEDIVWSIAFSPGGKQLASGSADRSVIVWELRTGDIVGKPLTGHSRTVTSVAYSPDGRFIASRSWNGEIRVWSSQSGATVHIMEGCRKFGRLAYSHNGARIACCGEEGIIIRDAQSGDLLNELSNIGHVLDITYSQDGRFLVSGGLSQLIRIWDAESLTETVVLEGHVGYVFSVSFFSGENTLFSASNEGKMIRWDMSTHQMSGMAVQESDVWSAACSPNGQLYAAATKDGSLRVWDTESHFRAESDSVNDRLWWVACSPNGAEIASASSSGEIRVYSLGSGRLLRTLSGHSDAINSVAYSPDGSFLASGSDDCTVRVWDTVTGLELRKFEGHTEWVSAVIFLQGGRHIVSSSNDGTVRRWNMDDEDTDGTLLYSQRSPILRMCTSRDTKLLAFGDKNGCIRFGDPFGHGLETRELRIEPTSIVWALAVSPDETYLASGSKEEIIRLWNLKSQVDARELKGHTNYILSISFSQDGRRLLSSSGDNTIRQWRVDTGEELHQLNGHTNVISHSIYSVDEKHIISCSIDGTIRVWNVDIEENTCVQEISGVHSLPVLRDGWIKSETGELLLWVPSEYRNGVRDMSIRCIPADAPGHPVRLDCSKLLRGENWMDVFVSSEEKEITTP